MSEVRCTACGTPLEVVTDLAFGAPLQYDELPEGERTARATLTSDTCTIDGGYFFVRGCLEIPIRGRSDTFMWGVWCSLSQENYWRYLDLFESSDAVGEGRYFGWLCNRIPGHPDTLLLKTKVRVRGHPNRPAIELEPTDHPLSVHQREGIRPGELEKVLHEALHGRHAG